MRDTAHFDLHQFANRKAQPVAAHVTADGIESNSLSFDDYARSHCFQHKLFASRRTPPSWAFNLRDLGLLLARFLERRAGIICPRIDTPQRRVVHAHSKSLSSIPANAAVLSRMSADYVTAKNAGEEARARVIERQIRTLDGKLVLDQHGPTLIVGIVWYYYRCGYSSVDTAAALNHAVSPVGVRQVAHRLERLWERMQNGTDKKPAAKMMPAEREIKRAQSRAYSARTGNTCGPTA